MKITIVLPTYNEARNLPEMVSLLFKLPLSNLNIIVIDDNSPDHTGDIAEEVACSYPGRMKVVHNPGKMGLGAAYIKGFRLALKDGADIIGQMDSDFSHPVDKVVSLVESLKDCDIAIGSRYISGGSEWPPQQCA